MSLKKAPYCYEYPRPMVTVDAVVFRLREERWDVLLIQRENEPFAGRWALPGGFVDMEESLETAAVRELAEETGITGVRLEQLRAFGNPGRDPRGRNICVAFAGVLEDSAQTPCGADDALQAQWFEVTAPPPLAFDHDEILACAIEWLTRQFPPRPRGERGGNA
jgi:8-oxo-dGTP diphosphatase